MLGSAEKGWLCSGIFLLIIKLIVINLIVIIITVNYC